MKAAAASGATATNLICCVLLLAIIFGGAVIVGLINYPSISDNGDNDGTDDGTSDGGTDDDSGDDTTPPPEADQWVLVAKLGTWSSYWPHPAPDINVEIFDAATSSKVHTGIQYDGIFIEGNNHDWVVGTTHEDLVTGFMVTIQVWASDGYTLMITPNDYVDMAVGCAEATYNLYEPIDPAFAVGSIT